MDEDKMLETPKQPSETYTSIADNKTDITKLYKDEIESLRRNINETFTGSPI